MGKYRHAISITLVLAAMASCAGDDAARHAMQTADETPAALAPASGSRRVYSGTVEESMGADICFAVAGMVQDVKVRKGDRVKKGQLLALLDDAALRSAYAKAAAEQAKAQDRYDSLKKMRESRTVSQEDWSSAEYALYSAKSAAAIAKKAWEGCRLCAPIDGYVSEQFAGAGQAIAPGSPVVRLAQLDPVNVVIPVPESEIMNVAHGQTGVVAFGSRGKKYVGKVVRRDNAANPMSQTCQVRIKIDNPDEELLPGMTCQVSLAADGGSLLGAVPSR